MQEYEKRLLAKDHEIKAAQAAARELQKRLDQATAELADASHMLPPAPAAPQGDTTLHWAAKMRDYSSKQNNHIKHSKRKHQIRLSCLVI